MDRDSTDGVYVIFKTTQEQYMEELVPMFDEHYDYVTPSSIKIEVRFRTFDETHNWEVEDIIDPFTLEIMSSGEDLTSTCSYDDLKVKSGTEMYGLRTY
jgi:hypothetical protein